MPHASPRTLTSLNEVFAVLGGAIRPVEASTVALADALGAILSDALRAPEPVPPVALALRPGYAVPAAATQGASSYSPLPWPEPRRVAIGDALPQGADAVVPEGAVVAGPGWAEISEEAYPGEGVRRVGEDLARGALIRGAGERVRPADIAVGLRAGLRTCRIRRPSIAVLDRGEESGVAFLLAERCTRSGAKVVRDAQVAAFLDRVTASSVHLGCAIDDGGAVRAALDAAGWTPIAGALALRPGEETRVGLVSGVPVVVLPNRLEAALAVALALLEPTLACLTSAASGVPSPGMPLTRKIASTIGFTEIALLGRTPDGLEPIAVADLTAGAIVKADHWLVVPPDSEGFRAGAIVSADRL